MALAGVVTLSGLEHSHPACDTLRVSRRIRVFGSLRWGYLSNKFEHSPSLAHPLDASTGIGMICTRRRMGPFAPCG